MRYYYVITFILFTALFVGTCYGNNGYMIIHFFYNFLRIKSFLKKFLNNLAVFDEFECSEEGRKLGIRDKKLKECHSKCITDNSGDIFACRRRCIQRLSCANGIYFPPS